jgi:thiol:disulfide interchange protein DsbC
MFRKIIAVVLFLIMAGLLSTPGFSQTPSESLKKAFPKIKFDNLSPSTIKGIYEVSSPNGILYYAPEAECILIGEIISKDGRNLTEIKHQELLSSNIKGKLKEIPYDKAIKIGTGKHTIIEITDPDCSYCRRASAFLSKRTDVTRYVFFYPLPMHPNAKDKALYALCAKDKAKAYEEVMTGKFDDTPPKVCDDPQMADILKAHMELAERLGIKGTPFFFVDGKTAVFGADIQLLEKLLEKKK